MIEEHPPIMVNASKGFFISFIWFENTSANKNPKNAAPKTPAIHPCVGILVLISLIGMTELYQVVGMKKSLPAMAGYVTCLIYDGLVYIKKDEYCFRLGIIFLLVLMFTYIICFPKYRSEQITMIYFGFYYVAVMLMFIYQVRMAKGGEYLVWLIFIGAWGSDTFAYLIGRKFGKYKIVPKLSPKKSAQGCIAGVFGAAFLGFLFALVFSLLVVGS